MVGRIYHVGLTVSDLDKSIAFYRDILGLKYHDFSLIFKSKYIAQAQEMWYTAPM